jgi:cyclopropane fatty-acyl-phospholipid synthase-like methyltransferase
MDQDHRLTSKRFPRSSRYHPEWIQTSASGGANALWLTEWLTEAMPLQPGMKVLDLGCGRAMSSIFLRREFGVQVWATDLWFNASENLQRVRDAGVEDGVFPIHADARSLPFAAEFFDAIVSIDSFIYYGTDDHYLNYLARLMKPGGQIGIAQVGLTQEMSDPVPEHLREWWSQEQLWSFHSADWWRRHWGRTRIVDVDVADMLPDGWRYWLEWLRVVAPKNATEIKTLEADAGAHLGYVRAVGRRKVEVQLPEPIVAIPPLYERKPLLRGSGQAGP